MLQSPAERGPDPRLHPFAVDLAAVSVAAAPIKAGEADWSFMTSSDVLEALESTRDVQQRAGIVRRMAREGGPYVVVYQSQERVWPEVHEQAGTLSRELTFTGGRYAGRLVLVDLRRATEVQARHDAGDGEEHDEKQHAGKTDLDDLLRASALHRDCAGDEDHQHEDDDLDDDCDEHSHGVLR